MKSENYQKIGLVDYNFTLFKKALSDVLNGNNKK
jgi:hypothetical protein